MKFSDQIWQKNLHIYQKIVNHPFNRELADGTLCLSKFNFYMEQDSYYLIEFSKVLATIASRSRSATMVNDFLNFSQEALMAERELHTSFIGSSFDINALELSPACLSYTQHLIATASNKSIEEAVAAVIPCFWLYNCVGRQIGEHSIVNNPYSPWIQTYSSPEFDHATKKAIDILNEIAGQSSSHTQKLMESSFEYSALYEWHFWNDAYHQTTFKESICTFCHE